ncbi:serine-rich coiled-coil domain-containing protein 1 [Crotalus adamanteus]|uniref:Serine-rich coiled-coil domain-containing protein 1 n=1 Tax=Crotalus adamanteus TaxID=8729 RepID=A0AAW1B916_CROAD
MSPATSTNSLPVSPLTEEPLPFKDIMKDECLTLKLQLKEKDELISQLREELSKRNSSWAEKRNSSWEETLEKT